MRNSDLDFLCIIFAFLTGCILGYMAGSPTDCVHPQPPLSTPIVDVLPTMGQE